MRLEAEPWRADSNTGRSRICAHRPCLRPGSASLQLLPGPLSGNRPATLCSGSLSRGWGTGLGTGLGDAEDTFLPGLPWGCDGPPSRVKGQIPVRGIQCPQLRGQLWNLHSSRPLTVYKQPSPSSWQELQASRKQAPGGFPGGAVVENLPANAGDTGSSPGLGRSHMPRSN